MNGASGENGVPVINSVHPLVLVTMEQLNEIDPYKQRHNITGWNAKAPISPQIVATLMNVHVS